MISQDIIEDVRSRSDIVEIISETVDLKKKGNNWVSACPFLDHTDADPSFSVSAPKQIYKCFGCGKGGNVYTFLIEQRGMTFIEAVKYLAGKLGIVLDYVENDKGLSDHLYELHSRAIEIFGNPIKERDYFQKRGLSIETIVRFALGYCESLYDKIGKEYSQEVIESSGLFTTSGFSILDMHRNRYTISLLDDQGRCIGYASTGPNAEPKYLNPTTTLIYDKSRFLYGLFQAKHYIQKKGYVVLVEGYMDCLSMHQHGFKTTVAVCGTALTDSQVKLLKRFTDTVLIFTDGDAAGRKAIDKFFVACFNQGVNVFVCYCPDGEDPDSLLSEDKSVVTSLLKDAKDWFDYRLGSVSEDELLGCCQEVTRLYNEIEDENRASLFVDIAANYLSVDPKSLMKRKVVYNKQTTDVHKFFKQYQLELSFLASCLSDIVGARNLWGNLYGIDLDKVKEELFDSEDLLAVYAAIRDCGDDKANLYNKLTGFQATIISRLLDIDIPGISLDAGMQVLRSYRRIQRKNELVDRIREAEENGKMNQELVSQLQQITG